MVNPLYERRGYGSTVGREKETSRRRDVGPEVLPAGEAKWGGDGGRVTVYQSAPSPFQTGMEPACPHHSKDSAAGAEVSGDRGNGEPVNGVPDVRKTGRIYYLSKKRVQIFNKTFPHFDKCRGFVTRANQYRENGILHHALWAEKPSNRRPGAGGPPPPRPRGWWVGVVVPPILRRPEQGGYLRPRDRIPRRPFRWVARHSFSVAQPWRGLTARGASVVGIVVDLRGLCAHVGRSLDHVVNLRRCKVELINVGASLGCI